ncbi:MAG TPA: glycine cleavage T C-terminal barrel domain-containing protein [Beutenbergiaceae bacterium]|nr:glycine cleavage T C-terminal barrel domain-containing protein [Beutenbergiaceae bacterium]
MTDYRSPLIDLSFSQGAVVGTTAPDAGVAAHYGEPLIEQRALSRGVALVDLSHLDVVTVTGPDRLTWLNILSTQKLDDLAPGSSTEFFLLDMNGRIEHAAKMFDDGDTAWLIADSGRGEALADFLAWMKFAYDVEIASPEFAVIGTRQDGPELVGVDGQTLPVWRDPWPAVGEGGTEYTRLDEPHPGNEWQAAMWFVPRDDLPAVVKQAVDAGARMAGTWGWEALRIASWRPRFNRDVDERSIPHELDWIRTGVHLNKGCYKGQETIARVFNMGKPPRRLVFLHLDGSEHTFPQPGDEVVAGERKVGTVTSVGQHHVQGPIALALVRRGTAEDIDLVAGGVAASQEPIVNRDGEGTGRPEQPDRQKFRRPGGPSTTNLSRRGG